MLVQLSLKAGLLLVVSSLSCFAFVQVEGEMMKHPITGSSQPEGAFCRAHSDENVAYNPDKIAKLYLNETLIPVTWDIAEGCPIMHEGYPGGSKVEWACCSKAQYTEMKTKDSILTATLTDCPACISALRNIFCWYTCGPFQGMSNTDTFHVNSTGQVLQTQFNITQELVNRLWDSCQNAAMAGVPIKVLYKHSRAKGLLSLISGFSPTIHGPDGTPYKILANPIIVDTCDPNALGQNVTTTECDSSCSNPFYPSSCETKPLNCSDYHGSDSGPMNFVTPPPLSYPLPKATIASLPVQDFVAIILAILVALVTLVGWLNRDSTMEEWLEKKESRDSDPEADDDDDGDLEGRSRKQHQLNNSQPLVSGMVSSSQSSRSSRIPEKSLLAGGESSSSSGSTNGNYGALLTPETNSTNATPAVSRNNRQQFPPE